MVSIFKVGNEFFYIHSYFRQTFKVSSILLHRALSVVYTFAASSNDFRYEFLHSDSLSPEISLSDWANWSIFDHLSSSYSWVPRWVF